VYFKAEGTYHKIGDFVQVTTHEFQHWFYYAVSELESQADAPRSYYKSNPPENTVFPLLKYLLDPIVCSNYPVAILIVFLHISILLLVLVSLSTKR
jgi:hypothetical protein